MKVTTAEKLEVAEILGHIHMLNYEQQQRVLHAFVGLGIIDSPQHKKERRSNEH